jgi:hypothetical protein
VSASRPSVVSTPFHVGGCYACDDTAVGVRDRRPEGGMIEAACRRHADPTLRAFAACCFCSGARPSLVIDGQFAHKSCHTAAQEG